MLTLFRNIGRFLNNMDARAWTSLIVTASLLSFVVFMLIHGIEWLGLNQTAVDDIMTRVKDSPFALVGTIAVFCALALTGFPQTLIFVGTVSVFGAVAGFWYSWIATMASATLTFYFGHAFGRGFVRRLSAGRAASMIEVIRARGILTTMIVRWVPTAPFIVINAVCGAAHLSIMKFWIGTAIGITPKILFVALFTNQVADLANFFKERTAQDYLAVGLTVVAWIAFLLVARAIYKRLRGGALKGIDGE